MRNHSPRWVAAPVGWAAASTSPLRAPIVYGYKVKFSGNIVPFNLQISGRRGPKILLAMIILHHFQNGQSSWKGSMKFACSICVSVVSVCNVLSTSGTQRSSIGNISNGCFFSCTCFVILGFVSREPLGLPGWRYVFSISCTRRSRHYRSTVRSFYEGIFWVTTTSQLCKSTSAVLPWESPNSSHHMDCVTYAHVFRFQTSRIVLVLTPYSLE